MEKTVLNVDGMSCQHCVSAVTKAVSALPGIGGVAIELEAKTVAVDFDPSLSSLDDIKTAIEDQGYDVI